MVPKSWTEKIKSILASVNILKASWHYYKEDGGNRLVLPGR